MRSLTASFVVACAVLVGCITPPAAEPGAIPDDGPPAALEAATITGIYAEPIQLQGGRYVGHLVYGHESREFVSCDGQRYWVADASGGDLRRTYEAMIGAPYQPLFVELSGSRLQAPKAAFADAYEEQLRATALNRVETEGPGCALDLAGAQFRASGVEPFWRVDVGSETLRFLRLGHAPISVAIEAHEFDGPTQIWRGETDAGALVLTLEEDRCTNPMSGSLFAYSAVVSLGGEAFSGCALTPLPYPSEPPSATSR